MWNPELGEVAVAALEVGNAHDRNTVAILEDHTCCTRKEAGFLLAMVDRNSPSNFASSVMFLCNVFSNFASSEN